MSSQLPVPAASNTFNRIKRLNPEGHEFWSARELARVLEYTDFRNFTAVITKAREACVNSGDKVANHFVSPTILLTSTKWSASSQARNGRLKTGHCPAIRVRKPGACLAL